MTVNVSAQWGYTIDNRSALRGCTIVTCNKPCRNGNTSFGHFLWKLFTWYLHSWDLRLWHLHRWLVRYKTPLPLGLVTWTNHLPVTSSARRFQTTSTPWSRSGRFDPNPRPLSVVFCFYHFLAMDWNGSKSRMVRRPDCAITKCASLNDTLRYSVE